MTRILVVDNNPMVLEFMKEILSGKDRPVETVSSGLDALESVQQTAPDIIFVDLVMPQIDGKQLCKLFRTKKKTANAFLVIISAIAAEEQSFDFTELADAYIAKVPFSKMKDYILKLVEDVEQGNTDHYQDGIVGLDQIYHREITRELLFSKKHIETLIASITDGFLELDERHRIIYLNEAALRFFGIKQEKLVTSYLPDLFPPETRKIIETTLDELNGGEIVLGDEKTILMRNRQLRLRFNSVRYGEYRSVIIILQDITVQKQAEQIIKDDLHQKEVLLKEVHHRVKNNLAVIASLLNLQSSFVSDKKARKHLSDSKNRVESMALVHERLYSTESLTGIYLDTYLQDLSSHLIDTYNRSQLPVRSYLDIPTLHLEISAAVPLGLIINELISNSLEHGLEKGTEGIIEIRLEEKKNRYCLTVRDNGSGLPKDFDINSTDTLGLMLVLSLCQQIDAEFSIKSAKGTTASICFDKKSGVFSK